MKVKQKKWNCSNGLTARIIVALSCLVVVGGLLWGAQTAYGGTSDGVCMVDRYNAKKGANVSSLNCTSNDVKLAQFTLISGPTGVFQARESKSF